MVELPRIVIAGRPNVGKSTLFNRLVGSRLALVADTPGVTRDRKEAVCEMDGRKVVMVDTAGLEEAPPDTLPGRMRASTSTAVDQADLVLFVFDAKAGLLPEDRHFGTWLRRKDRPVLVIANKAEGKGGAANAMEAYELGFGEPVAVSAEHNEGIYDLMSEIAARLPEPQALGEDGEELPLHLAIVGRPNAGKSTLLNYLLGEERMITGPEPGLTRDAVSADFEGPDGKLYRVVDTAGLRKRAKVDEGLEKMSTSSSIEALKRAEMAVLAIDAVQGVQEQDLQIARLIEREGRACVIALTKWDAVEDRPDAKKAALDRISISLSQMKGITVVPLSAETGEGVKKLFPAIRDTYEKWNTRFPTSQLNRWFESALERFPPPLVDGRRLKLRYITQIKARPPTFALFGTRAEQVPETYQRYLVNSLREVFEMPGVPIRIYLRGTKNPFEGKD
ncbi:MULTISPECIES: ribosome biogenesis GTPase Der [Acidocella]|uniref:ribosome biogenesis GTPase Der n=1 Tax=Acidocella TaxID=50709 RepID=UPI00028E1C94|nr:MULTISPECIES: ribosome biogenesis GTPase Der [Acidocella]EKN01404.1 GTP-binding protein Der [Acidocella sp. MX-AZ02]WBO60914.1 ribosome biogenesis GTPase Der [Acidocella sp. MX-AZ03]